MRLLRRLRLFAIIFGGLAVLLPPRLIRLALAGDRPSRIGALYLRMLLTGLRIRVETRGVFVGDALAIANHVSWIDILVLGGIRPSRFVAKSDVRAWPLLGLLARLNGTIFIRRDARGAARDQIAAVAAALARGPVTLLPEGTTGDGAALLPFRSTLFAAAAGRTVQPISILYRPRGRGWQSGERAAFAWDGDKPFWAHFLAIGGGRAIDCLVIAHEPISMTSANRKALALTCREIIRGGLDEHDKESG